MRVKIHTDTFGITQRALKALRDELADRIDHRIEVWELPSSDGIHVEVYGVCIIDATADEAVIIGDGFRGDGGGEGGAGHRAAQALLSIYNISHTWTAWALPVRFDQDTDWQRLVNEIAPLFGESVATGRDRMPGYIDHVGGKKR